MPTPSCVRSRPLPHPPTTVPCLTVAQGWHLLSAMPLSSTDRLALERTLLANERTLLAWVRTALALAGGGAGLAAFVPGPLAGAAGWALGVAGVVGLAVGVRRYLTLRRDLKRDYPQPPPREPGGA